MDPSLCSAIIRIGKGDDPILSTQCDIKRHEKTAYLQFKMSDGNDWNMNGLLMAIEVTVAYKGKIFLSVSFGSEVSIFKRTEHNDKIWYVEQTTHTISATVRIFKAGSSQSPISGLLVIISELDLNKIIKNIS